MEQTEYQILENSYRHDAATHLRNRIIDEGLASIGFGYDEHTVREELSVLRGAKAICQPAIDVLNMERNALSEQL